VGPDSLAGSQDLSNHPRSPGADAQSRNESLSHVGLEPYFADVPLTPGTVLPVLSSAPELPDDDPHSPVLDEFVDGILVGYTFGPPYGKRLITWQDLERIEEPRRNLRRQAADNLDAKLSEARVHGQPPALMLGFDGLASTLLLAESLWAGLADSVPGDLVVGVPARDVVIVTGSQSRTGMEKVRRAVNRVYFAGDRHLLTRQLLVRRAGVWEITS
jgi:uncharacterized protein YtpQ (UPF0354 family)